ncbi:MAG TPA: oxygenase MpaB family protein [Cytophagales bacterium]|nr:oxygenase MpaB family protein [Cytophagales bacterium]
MKLSEESYKISQKIWSSTDVILLVFAGSAAEFATIKAVDWLFYTNKLPSAPIDRLFDTARFAQWLFFSTPSAAAHTLETINKVHSSVERSRGMNIPNWAYKDVLYMLIDYSERGYKIVYGEMTSKEKQAYFEAAMAVGKGMHLEDLPETYEAYLADRKLSLERDYELSMFTSELFNRYKQSLGKIRYGMLRMIQANIVPAELNKILKLKANPAIDILLKWYHKLPGGGEKLKFMHDVLLPRKYTEQLKNLGKIELTSFNAHSKVRSAMV